MMIACCKAIGVGTLLGIVLAAVIFRVSDNFDPRVDPRV